MFLDVDSLRYGANFRKVIRETIAGCRSCLVIIGKNWHGDSGAGIARIHNKGDFVRVEVEAALAAPATTVIPVLIGETPMPDATDLPAPLRPLLTCHAVHLRVDPHFQKDIDELVERLELVPEIAQDEMSLFDMFVSQIDWCALDEERRTTVNLVLGMLLSCVEGKELNSDKLARLASVVSGGQLPFAAPEE